MTTDHEGDYGLFAIGEACVALPLTAVREVTPCPGELTTLPVEAPGLLGALNLRGQVIVVIDLLALNPPEDTAAPERTGRRVIVVLVDGDRLLGLVVDGVHGVTTPTAMQRMGTTDGHGLPVSHTFPAPDDGAIVSVLDVETVFSLPGVPVVYSSGRSAQEGAFTVEDGENPGGVSDLSGSMLLVRCAEHRLAVNIEAVHTIVPRVQVRTSPLRHGSCKGVTDYGGAEIPVFDPLELSGLGELTTGDTEGVAVRFEDGVVVMLLSEVLELIPAAAAERLGMPAVPVPGARYLDGVIRVPDRGDFLSLAIDQILRHEDLNALSRLNTPHVGAGGELVPAQRSADWNEGGSGEDRGEGATRAGDTYLTFSLSDREKDFAVPLDQVREILPFPSHYSALQGGAPEVLGLFTHRDIVVPLFRTAALLSPARPPDPGDLAYVLVVGTGDERQVVGLAVHALRAIERSIWEDPAVPDPAPPGPGEPPEDLHRALTRRRTIRLAAVGTSDEPRMLSRVDLSAIGTALVPQPFEPEPLQTSLKNSMMDVCEDEGGNLA